MKAFRKLWDRLNGDRDDRDDYANRLDAARARGAARRRALFDPLPALSYAPEKVGELVKQRMEAENMALRARVKDLEAEVAMYRALF